jgi:heptaprenylglyceryl phosphate synthase
VPTPESMDAQIGLTRLLALDAVYLYSRFTGVPPEVTRYFRQRLHPDQLIFVGGGIRNRAQVDDHIDAGADYVIFAGALETPDWRPELDRLCAPAREQAAAVQERNPHD